jgi:hypothetical protein
VTIAELIPSLLGSQPQPLDPPPRRRRRPGPERRGPGLRGAAQIGAAQAPGHAILMDRVIASFLERGAWPSLAALQRDLGSRRLDAAAILRTLAGAPTARACAPAELQWAGPAHPGAQVSLSVGGLAARPAGRRVAEAFVAILDLAAGRFPARGDARILESEAMMSLELDELTDALAGRFLPIEIRRACPLFKAEPGPAAYTWSWAPPGGGERWRLDLTAGIRSYAGLGVESYIARHSSDWRRLYSPAPPAAIDW